MTPAHPLLVVGLVGLVAGCSGATTQGPRSSGGSAVATIVGVEWRTGPAGSVERSEVAATVAGDRIFVAGGFGPDDATVGTVEVLDVRTGSWSALPDFPVPANHAMAATFDAVPYVFGGYDADNRASRGAHRLAGDRWVAVASMPKGRGAGSAVTIGDEVYIVGGVEAGTAPANDMLVYSPRTDSWRITNGPPTPREHLGAAGFRNNLYVVGGRSATQGNFDAFEVFDVTSGTWSVLAPMPTRRGGLAATATCNGQVVAVGGEADATFPEVEAYDIATRSWRALPDLPTARHGLGVVAHGAVVHVVHGGPAPGLSRSAVNEAIDLGTLGPCNT